MFALNRLLLALMVFGMNAGSSFAQQTAPASNRPAPVVRQLPCLVLSDAKADQTPPELHTAIGKCVAAADYDKAAKLFILSGAFSRFDATRVADVSARGAGQVLIMRTFSTFSDTQRAEFSKATDSLINDPKTMSAICQEVRKIGAPSYHPTYMILHGMNAIMNQSTATNALVADFDAVNAWKNLQKNYLRCPDSQ